MIAPISKNPALVAETDSFSSPYIAVAGRVLMASISSCGAGSASCSIQLRRWATSALSACPCPQVGLGIAIVVELAGGVALVLGYRTKLVAAVLALFSIATALAFHSAFGDQNQLIHFFKNIAMAGGLLQIAAFGAGPIAIDNRR